MSLLQNYQWVCRWKNFENQLIFEEVMGKSLVSCFFDSRCSYAVSVMVHFLTMNKLCWLLTGTIASVYAVKLSNASILIPLRTTPWRCLPACMYCQLYTVCICNNWINCYFYWTHYRLCPIWLFRLFHNMRMRSSNIQNWHNAYLCTCTSWTIF